MRTKKRQIALTIILLLNISFNIENAFSIFDGKKEASNEIKHHPHELLVKFKDGTDLKKVFEKKKIKKINDKFKLRKKSKVFDKILKSKKYKKRKKTKHTENLKRWFVLSFPMNSDITNIMLKYRNIPEIEYIEFNYKYEPQSIFPNDTLFDYQWALHNTGQQYPTRSGTYQGSSNADMNAPEGWEYETGSSSDIVAVIDTGIDYNHEDLVNNIWINPGEIADNNIDDDGNGYIDDVNGWDFSDNDNDPYDYHGHGSHCAGIICAIGNNAKGITGLNWNAKVMAVKIFPMAFENIIAPAIIYAADNGARTLSNSWGGGGHSLIIQEAIDYAYEDKDCVVVFAAGNGYDQTKHYPAAGNNTLAVIATDSDDNRAYFSTHGFWCDLSAPGHDILSLRGGDTDMYGDGLNIVSNNYYICSGTSMACPYAAGLASLIRSKYPALSNTEVEEMMKSGCDDLGNPGFDAEFAHGRINVQKTFYNYLNAGPITYHSVVIDDDNNGTSSGNDDNVINPGEVIELKVSLKNMGGQTANLVSAVLSTTDSYIISISDNNEDFGNIEGYNIKECPDDFDISISPSCPIGHILNINLNITDNSSNTWNQNFEISVGIYGADLIHTTTNINDDTGYMNNIVNGKANAGEFIQISVVISNIGDQTAESVIASLETTDTNVFALPWTVNYYDILPGESYLPYNGFYVFINPDVTNNHVVDFDMIMYDSNNKSWTDQFSIIIEGVTEPYLTLNNYSIDDDDIGSSDGNSDGALNPGETIELDLTLRNAGIDATNVTAYLSTSDPYIKISSNTVYFSNIAQYQIKQCINKFVLSISNTTPVDYNINFIIEIAEQGIIKWTNTLYSMVYEPFTPTGAPILVVEKSYFKQYFSDALNANLYSYDIWDCSKYSEAPLSILNLYDIVIWATGNNWIQTFTPIDQENVKNYLENGGKMFVTGQDVGFDIGYTTFYNNYLHARFVGDDVNLYKVKGKPGDDISDGVTLNISGGDGANNQWYPSEIEAISPAEAIFTYDETSALVDSMFTTNRGYDTNRALNTINGISENGTCGLKIDNGIYKMVYFSFGFEAIDNAEDRTLLMKKVLNWIGHTNNDVYLGPYYVSTNGSDSNNGSFTNPFKTIQKAASLLSSPLTSSTCYILPGVYSETIELSYNGNTNNMVFTKLSNTKPVLDGHNINNYGFKLDNANRIELNGLEVRNFTTSGIFITGTSESNKIYDCTIKSNSNGINFNNNNVKNNLVNNNIIISNERYGIYLYRCSFNNILSNKIHHCGNSGIHLAYESHNNIIEKNLIYSNNNYGIYLYLSHDNLINKNEIFGGNQYSGLRFYRADNNIITSNKIYNNSSVGIYLYNNETRNNLIVFNQIYNNNSVGIYVSRANNNNIIKNDIFNNSSCGIRLNTYASNNSVLSNSIYSNYNYGVYLASDHNEIYNNRISGPEQNYGIYLTGNCNDNVIFRNLITENDNYGIQNSTQNSTNNIINNTIYKNHYYDGIYISNSASCRIINNIIMSNGSFLNSYGIDNNSSGIVYSTNNIIFGNYGGNKNGTFSGGGDIYLDPLLDTVTSFTIRSISSPAIDSGIIEYPINRYTGCGPDIGYIESSFNAGACDNFKPVINNLNPANNDINVPPESNITFDVYDLENNILPDSIEVYINGKTAFSNGVFIEEYNGTNSKIICLIVENGFSVTIDPVSNFSNSKTINVHLEARDSFSNLAVTNYSFTITLSLPAKPEIISVLPVSASELEITWNDLPAELTYNLYRSVNDDFNTSEYIITLPGNQTNYTDISLESETTYYYWVTAHNNSGGSPVSDSGSGTTKSYLPDIFAVFPTYFQPLYDNYAKIYFKGIKVDVDVRIYDAGGNVIRSWKNIKNQKYIEWDGKNEQGNMVNSGVYIVYIRGTNIDEKIKMMLIR